MKLTVSQLRRIIKEVATAAAALPKEGDVYITVESAEYGGEEVFHNPIMEAGDLAAMPDDVPYYSAGTGDPEPGEPGVWILVDPSESAFTFAPGELVRIPEYDDNVSQAWTRKRYLAKIKSMKQGVSGKDKKILDMLGKVTTYGAPSLNAMKAFSIRLRKGSIAFDYDPMGKGVTGSILPTDLKGTGLKSLEELADWMFEHGAQKIRPQRRRSSSSYYD